MKKETILFFTDNLDNCYILDVFEDNDNLNLEFRGYHNLIEYYNNSTEAFMKEHADVFWEVSPAHQKLFAEELTIPETIEYLKERFEFMLNLNSATNRLHNKISSFLTRHIEVQFYNENYIEAYTGTFIIHRIKKMLEKGGGDYYDVIGKNYRARGLYGIIRNVILSMNNLDIESLNKYFEYIRIKAVGDGLFEVEEKPIDLPKLPYELVLDLPRIHV